MVNNARAVTGFQTVCWHESLTALINQSTYVSTRCTSQLRFKVKTNPSRHDMGPTQTLVVLDSTLYFIQFELPRVVKVVMAWVICINEGAGCLYCFYWPVGGSKDEYWPFQLVWLLICANDFSTYDWYLHAWNSMIALLASVSGYSMFGSLESSLIASYTWAAVCNERRCDEKIT